jgi:hypothetical protein
MPKYTLIVTALLLCLVSSIAVATGSAAVDTDVSYSGYIRVFVTEINSRWHDAAGRSFRYAFLDFALRDTFYLGPEQQLTWDTVWDGSGFSNLDQANIKIIAALYDSSCYTGYSYPPDGWEFDIHEVDACAAAVCGETGHNLKTADFTHTVLVEDLTASW